MKSLMLIAAAAAAVAAAPAAASPTLRLAILHVVNGCHVWSTNEKPNATVVLKRGSRLELRPNCPMDFDLRQSAGPDVAAAGRIYAGTTRTIVFRKRGVYRFVATNVQTPEEQGLQTLGPANTLTLTVRVR